MQNPINPGIKFFTKKPLNDNTNAISVGTLYAERNTTKAPSLKPRPPMVKGITYAIITDIMLNKTKSTNEMSIEKERASTYTCIAVIIHITESMIKGIIKSRNLGMFLYKREIMISRLSL